MHDKENAHLYAELNKLQENSHRDNEMLLNREKEISDLKTKLSKIKLIFDNKIMQLLKDYDLINEVTDLVNEDGSI